MESICSFEPVWSRDEAVSTPRESIRALHERVLQFLLKDLVHQESAEPLPIDEVIHACLRAIESLLRGNVEDDNPIVRVLSEAGARHNDISTPTKEAIHQWYRSAVPAVTRDPSSGLAHTTIAEAEFPGAARDVWDRDQATEQFFYGNMGLISMLMTSEAWKTPASSELFGVSLCANATTSIMYAAFMIISTNPAVNSSGRQLSTSQIFEAFRLYVRSSWLLARDGQVQMPGQDYGTTTDELKMSNDGKRLLSKIGRSEWTEAPLWHPVRKVPGSPWNKFIRNTGQMLFQMEGDTEGPTSFQVPSSALTLVEPWEQYYADIRARFDQTSRERTVCSTGEAKRQFAELSERSGLPYRERNLKEDDAAQADDINQVYAYHLPMVKKAISDAHGDLTLPFVTTASRALRFEEDPQELEPDFFVMTFDG